MCGIVGQARADGAPVQAALLERMCRALEHRGPDARGVHVDGPAGLGIQRLRIIDLVTGDQPLFNEDGTVAVVLNGEIYNYRELRDGLVRRGHRLATASDTEVLVHLYEDHGPDLVQHLHGMFAFALWDARRRRLLLARDRVGKKPLFYCVAGGALTFASELGALLAHPGVPRDVDYRALDAYLAYRWVPSPLSAFRHVRKLPPGCRLTFQDGRVDVQRWWRLRFAPKLETRDEGELAARLRELLRAATRRRMVADVPLGAFLSGGVDSSAVVAAMAEASPRPVKTFSIGFTSDAYDELPRARLIARELGTDHHELVVRPDAIEMLPRIIRHHGEPFADASAIPSFYVAQMARRHVTVALNGDGGDESFAGYTRYVSNVALARLDGVPRPLRRAGARLAALLPASGRVDSWPSRLRRAAAGAGLAAPERYVAYMSDLIGLDRSRLYTPAFAELAGEEPAEEVMLGPWRASTGSAPLDRMLDVDVATYLPDDLLAKMDIATMAFSLEARSPLLDHELMEFAAALPPELKLRGREKKHLLRRALRGWIPDEILDGRKMGFRSPIADWLRGELRDYAREVLLDGTARRRGWFREDYVRGLLDAHAAGQADHAQAIWTLLNFELWHRDVVDAPAAEAVAA